MPAKRTKKQLLFDLSMEVEACNRCPYSSTRDAPILGNGEHRSPILFVAPNVRKRDDEEGIVFSGRAHDKLGKMLTKAELDISKVYMTPLIRCYAGREPEFGEFGAFARCQSYSVKLMKILRPAVVVVCGLKVFKWLIVRWSNEVVDEHTFYKWIGKSVRLKEVWGDMKFFIIESPAELSKKRNPEAEAKSVEALQLMKAYVVSQQKGDPIALEMDDLKKRNRKRNQQQQFDWA
jgi:uracil-DNA glycosylase family 4